MSIGAILVHAPSDGRVVYLAPPELSGELELFDGGDVLAHIERSGDPEPVPAPSRGFVFRRLVPDGVDVAAGTPLLVYRNV